jgi:hypothetical protein
MDIEWIDELQVSGLYSRLIPQCGVLPTVWVHAANGGLVVVLGVEGRLGFRQPEMPRYVGPDAHTRRPARHNAVDRL